MSDFSGVWNGGDGAITDITKYLGTVGGSGGGYLAAVIPSEYDEHPVEYAIQDGLPLAEALGLSTAYVHLNHGTTDFFAFVFAAPTAAAPGSSIGPTSQLTFSSTQPQTQGAVTNFSYMPDDPDAPALPPVPGILVFNTPAPSYHKSPNYTVSGAANVAEIATNSGAAAFGSVTFTGALTVALFTVDGVLTIVDGGSLTLSAANEASANNQNVATVDGDGTLEFINGATGTFMAAVDGLQVDDGAVVVSGQGSMITAQGLELGEITAGGSTLTGDGTLEVLAGGVASITAGNGYHFYVGDAAGADGTIVVSGGGSMLAIDGTITIGNSGEGTLAVAGGGAAMVTGDVTLGAQAGSIGSIDLAGQGSDLTITGTLTIGAAGTGDLSVGDGATLDPILIILGANAVPMMADGTSGPTGSATGLHTTGVDAATMTGGLVQADTLIVGLAGRGSVTMTGGSLDIADETTLGQQEGAEGAITLTGDDTDFSAGTLTVGDAGKGVLSIADGASVDADAGTIGAQSGGMGLVLIGDDGSLSVDLIVGDAGSGTLAVDGGMLDPGDELILGNQSTGSGQVVFSGGVLSMDGGTITVGNAGKGVLTFEQGASLPSNGDLDAPDATLGEQFGSTGSMTVTDPGTAVHLGAITVGDSGKGSLTVTNDGALYDSGDADIAGAVVANIQGAVVSNGGLWQIAGGLTVGAAGIGTLTIKSAGQVFSANDVTIADSAGSGGLIVVTGTAGDGNSATVPSSLGWGTALTIGNFGAGSLSVAAGAIVAPEVNGVGLIQIGAAPGGSGIVSVTGGTLDGNTLEIGATQTGSPGASGRLSIGTGGIVDIDGATTLAATGAVTLSGGTFDAGALALEAGAQIGGSGTIAGAILDDGLITAKGGALVLDASLDGTGSATVKSGATLVIAGADTLRSIVLSGTRDVLNIGAPGTGVAISGFVATDTIDLAATAGGTAAHVTGGVLDITNADGTVIAALKLSGSYADASFDVTASGGATFISLAASQPDGGPTVTPPPVQVSVPQSTTSVGGGDTVALDGLAVTDSNAGATLTATLAATTGLLGVASSSGITVQSDAGGTILVLSGDAADVNAALGGVTYTAEAAGTDTVSLTATDNDGDGDTDTLAISVPDQPPTLGAPGTQIVVAGTAAPVIGLVVSGALAQDAIFTVTLADNTGTLTAGTNGASEVDGSGSTALTITGDLADVNADLASLAYLGASTGTAASVSDTIAVTVDDGTGGTASASIAVTVDRAPDFPATITLPAGPPLVAGTATAIHGLALADADTTGKLFTVTLTVGQGTLAATAAGAATLAGDGTATLTVSGVLTDVDSTLGSLTDTATTPDSGVSATDTLTVTVADNIGAAASAGLPIAIDAPDAFVWTSPSGGTYADAADWQPAGGPPGTADIAAFPTIGGAGVYTVAGDGTAGQLQITGDPSFTGTITALGLSGVTGAAVVDGGADAGFAAGAALITQTTAIIGDATTGTLSFAGGSSATFDTTEQSGAAVAVDLGLTAGSGGLLTATGPDTTLTSDSDWIIGDGGGGDALIGSGAVVTVGTGESSLAYDSSVIGNQASGNGELEVYGAGSQFDDTGALIVGDAGSGDLIVSSSATLTSDAPAADASAVLGYQSTGNGIALIENTGALWDSQQDAEIGFDGTGMLIVLNGGTFEVDGALLNVGRDAGSSGSLFLTGAGSTLDAPAATLNIGNAGTGMITVEDGAAASVASLVLGAQAGGMGSLDIEGGTVTVSGGLSINAGTVTIFSDGTADSGLLAAQTATIGAGGYLEDDGTIAVSGGLTLDGGTLDSAFSGASFASPITVAAGTDAAPSGLTGGLTLTAAVSLDANVSLAIGADDILTTGITGFSPSDTLIFDETDFGVPIDSAVWSDGTLNLFDDSGDKLLTLLLPGDYSADAFAVTQSGTDADVTVGPSFAPATPYVWFGGAGGFDTGADWSYGGSSGVVPGTSDTAAFTQGGTLQGSGTVGTFQITSAALFDGIFATVGATIDSGGTLGIVAGASLAASGLLTVGYSGDGTLDVGAGGTVSDTAFIDIGQRGAGLGLIDVAGAAAVLTDTGAIEIGESGTGTLVVGTGGSVTANFAELGDALGSSGTMLIGAGGSFNDGSTTVGDDGSGTLTISGGGTLSQTSFATIGNTEYGPFGSTVTVAGLWSIGSSLDVGYDDASTLDVTAGGTVSVGSYLRLGADADGTGTLAVSGTGASISVAGPAYIGVAGAGDLAVSAGGSLILSTTDPTTPALVLGDQSGGFGTLGLAGPTTLSVGGGGIADGVAGDGTITLSDGASLTAASAAPDDFAAITLGGATQASGSLSIDGAGSTFTADAGGMIVGADGSGAVSVTDGGALVVDDGVNGLVINNTVSVDGAGSTLGANAIVLGNPTSDLSATLTLASQASASATDVTNDGLVLVTAATLDIAGAVSGVGSIFVQGGSLVVDGAVSVGQQITLDPSRFEIGDVAAFQGTLTLSGGDTLLVDGANGASYANGVFTMTEGGSAIGTIAAPGDSAGDFTFQTIGDAEQITDAAPCYAAGTLIRTARGDVPVEALDSGDLVPTLFGEMLPVRWIGRRDIAFGRRPSPRHSPIRVAAGAFGHGLPRRDLMLSPEHAVFIHGVLIPIHRLLNGSTIRQIHVASVSYFHVELERHSLIFAEDLPAESWLDTGNRGSFGNAATAPDGPAVRPGALPPCAPIVESGALLDLVRADLRDHAASLRAPAPGELPVTLEPGEICLTLPPWVGLLRLVTPSSVTPGDERRLGAAITRLLVDDDDLTLSDPRLVSGFHALETTGGRSWRWTDGDAVLLLDVASRARDVRITVAACAAQRRAA